MKICQFKAKYSEIKPYPLCLGNVSKDIKLDNMKKTWLKGSVKVFSVDYNAIDTNNILDIRRYLVKETRYKIVFGFIKKMFIGLLTSIVNTFNHTKCLSLYNQQCMIQPILINLHSNEYTQESRYYLFAVNLERCNGSCNVLNDVSSRVCVPNKTEDLNKHVFNMITRINESKVFTKHISCKCECMFDGRKYNSNQKWNNDKCRFECKNSKEHHACQKNYIWNPAICSCKNGKYLASISDDSVIMCDEIVGTTKSILTKTVPTKTVPAKSYSKSFYLLLAFLLVTIALLLVVSIVLLLDKTSNKTKKHLLPYHVSTNELKAVLYR